jgi:hypothetical protein
MYNRREKALLSFGQHQQTPEIIIKQKEKDNRAEQKTRRRRRGMAPCDIPFRTLVITGKTKKNLVMSVNWWERDTTIRSSSGKVCE